MSIEFSIDQSDSRAGDRSVIRFCERDFRGGYSRASLEGESLAYSGAYPRH